MEAQLDSAAKEIVELRKSNDALRTKLHVAEVTNGQGRKRSRNADWESYTDRHKRRLIAERKTNCSASLHWLEEVGYVPLKVEVKNVRTGTTETIELDAEEMFGQDAESISNTDLETINMILFIKDRYNVSSRAYHELAKVCKSMPRYYKIQRRITELNEQWDIKPTPNGTCGVQQSLEDRLRQRVHHLCHISSPDTPFRRNHCLHVKLSGDGTNIGKRLHVVNFTFTLLEEGALAYSAEGNHSLAIIKESEDYDHMYKALKDIRLEVERLTTIEIDGTLYDIVYYLGGDWKFLAMCTGIDSATSEHACIWCKCPKDDRPNVDVEWSITDTSLGARTIEENVELSQSRRKRFNVSRHPLFPTIPLSHVVIDNLHMFLRVSDVLLNQLLDRLKAEDAIDKARKFTSWDITRHKHLKAYEDFMKSLSIPNYQFYLGKNSRVLKVRSLTGPEKLKLANHINIQSLLPRVAAEECSRIQDLWDDLLALNTLFSKRPDDITPDDISRYEARSKRWVEKFVGVYHRRYVTPYIHAMAAHVGQFMRLHGSILPFTQQGMEKLNDNITKIYFQSTSHKGTTALAQILEKQNRLDFLNDSGACPKKHHDKSCSLCGQAGHNQRTCSATQ